MPEEVNFSREINLEVGQKVPVEFTERIPLLYNEKGDIKINMPSNFTDRLLTMNAQVVGSDLVFQAVVKEVPDTARG